MLFFCDDFSLFLPKEVALRLGFVSLPCDEGVLPGKVERALGGGTDRFAFLEASILDPFLDFGGVRFRTITGSRRFFCTVGGSGAGTRESFDEAAIDATAFW